MAPKTKAELEAFNDGIRDDASASVGAFRVETAPIVEGATTVLFDAGERNPDAPDMSGAKPVVVDEETDTVMVKVTSAAQSPVRVSVNGRSVSLILNEAKAIPRYFLSAMRDSNIVFEEVSK